MINTFDGEFAFLSNFYEQKSRIMDGWGNRYPTVEHAFQAMKTTERQKRSEIANAATPGKAKRLGRQVQLRPDWEEIKEDVMRACLRAKFSNPALGEKLLATGDQWLEEGNTWHDNYWGVCQCERCQDIRGRNRLGHLLMELREEMRNGSQTNEVAHLQQF